jgi:N utilization substance protein A
MLSLAIGKEGQNARLAAKLTGWRIDIHSQSAKERAAEGVVEEPSSFVPVVPGEEPDLDLVAEFVAPEPEPERIVPAATIPAAVVAEAEPASTEEEDVTFAAALAQMEVPDRDEREAEDYGEEEEEEEYEVPSMVAPEDRPTAIRFAEDVLPRRPEEEEVAPKRQRRAPRILEEVEEDMEDIDYSGRIH